MPSVLVRAQMVLLSVTMLPGSEMHSPCSPDWSSPLGSHVRASRLLTSWPAVPCLTLSSAVAIANSPKQHSRPPQLALCVRHSLSEPPSGTEPFQTRSLVRARVTQRHRQWLALCLNHHPCATTALAPALSSNVGRPVDSNRRASACNPAAIRSCAIRASARSVPAA